MSIRLDKIMTLAFQPVLRSLGILNTVKIPILMYHSVCHGTTKNSASYYNTNTHPEVFKKQMQFLQQNGYKTMNLNKLINHMASALEFEKKYIIITFDDAHKSFYQEAFPVLRDCGFHSTVFIPTAFIKEQEEKESEYLSWGKIRELLRLGVSFGSHSINHYSLYLCDEKLLVQEIARSKEIIEDKIGSEVKFFSYPFAFPENDKYFKKKLRKILIESGYEGGVTTIIGRISHQGDNYFLKRLPVNTEDNLKFFYAKLEGAYDWLHGPQLLYKFFKFNYLKAFGGKKKFGENKQSRTI